MLKSSFAVCAVSVSALAFAGCVVPPTVTSNSWEVTWPQVSGAARYEVYVDAGDGSGTKAVGSTLAKDCGNGKCRANDLGRHPELPGAKVSVITVGVDGSRSDPSAWVPLYEEGAKPVVTNVHARAAASPANSGSDADAFRVNVTGDAQVRDGLNSEAFVRAGDLFGAYYIGPLNTPWSGPRSFTAPSRYDHQYYAGAASSLPDSVNVTVTAPYSHGVFFKTDLTLPVEANDRTPPPAPSISISGRTLRITPATGEQPTKYTIMSSTVSNGRGLRIANGAVGDNTIPTEWAPGYPVPAGVLFVVAYDDTGNWRASSAVPYTP